MSRSIIHSIVHSRSSSVLFKSHVWVFSRAFHITFSTLLGNILHIVLIRGGSTKCQRWICMIYTWDMIYTYDMHCCYRSSQSPIQLTASKWSKLACRTSCQRHKGWEFNMSNVSVGNQRLSLYSVRWTRWDVDFFQDGITEYVVYHTTQHSSGALLIINDRWAR